MTERTIRGIAIVAGIANTAVAAHQTFTEEQLKMLLELFDQHPNNTDGEYKNPGQLVLWAYNAYYNDGCPETSEHIREAFPWFIPKVDLSLLSKV
jgi:hypothetical protein